MNSQMRKVLTGIGLFVAGAVVAGAVAWALIAVTRPAVDPLESTDFTFVEVSAGEVGASMQLNTVAEWAPVPTGANRQAGVVTGIAIEPGAEVQQGSVLYSVDLRPVVVAQGSVPVFRDIAAGAAGADVDQLQQMLADLGFYRGEVGGGAGAMTVEAVKAWQKSLGVEQTGVVRAGDLMFIPTLPTRVALDTEVVFRGASLVGGEQVLSALPASPQFTIPVTETQLGMIPTGTRVEITSPEGATWTGYVGEVTGTTDSGSVTLALTGEEGAAICADQCAQIPVVGQASLSSKIVTVETVEGLIVPSSAIVSGAGGDLALIDEDGKRIPVTVVSAARGMSVVEGVQTGTKVRVPGATS